MSDWFVWQLRKMMKVGSDSGYEKAMKKLVDEVRSAGGSITERGLVRSGWNKDDVEVLVAKSAGKLLIETIQPGPKGGRPSSVVKLVSDKTDKTLMRVISP